jgi:biotin carboxyl carrier protein
MRFKVQQKGDVDAWFFEIGDHILANGLVSGQTFKAKRLTPDLKDAGELDVRLHPDGRSIAIDQTIIPFSGSGQILKGHDARIKMGAPSTFRRLSVEPVKPIAPKKASSNLGGGDQKSPLTGKVLSVLVKEGQEVSEGDVLVTIEAMKMENRILAECRGRIQNIKVSAGNSVSVGDSLCFLQPAIDENSK